MDEAEEELTHVCVKVKEQKAIILLEERKSGVGISRLL